MELETIRAAYTLLLGWFFAWLWARDWMRRVHGRWFQLSDGQFDAIHYAGMAGLKLAIWVFLLAPWLALHIVL